MKAKPALKNDHKDLSVPDGITLRDYFAAKAMPLFYEIWKEDYFNKNHFDAEFRASEGNREDLENCLKELIADHSYEMADAMLKARNA